MKKDFKIATMTIGVLLLTAGNSWASTVVYDKVELFKTEIGFSPVPAYASTISLPDASNPGAGYGRPDHIPPVNPPFDTPGRANAPVIPAVVPDHTRPGSDFGQAVVPVPAAVWLFGSGLLGLVGIARRKKA